jgi:polar amino acid transport system substrate-binding protein
MVESGEADGSLAFAKTDRRAKLVRYSRTPIGTVSMLFYHRRDVPFEWVQMEDLRQHRIGVMQGYSAAEEMEQLNKEGMGLKIEYATNEVLNFRKILDRRIDLFPAVSIVADWILREQFTPEERAQITTCADPWKVRELYVIFPLNSERGEMLDKAFTQGVEKLRTTGRYEVHMRALQEGTPPPDQGVPNLKPGTTCD